MKAVVFRGPYNVSVDEVPNPKLQSPNDAIVKITSSGLCGSDLHMYEGRTNAQPGMVLGHEPLGIVQEVGQGVQMIKPGERVVLPFNIACGTCYNCLRGHPNACLTTNPSRPGASYGYSAMGGYQGAQAEYLRVPFADYNALKLPGQPNDQMEDNFVLLADVFPTGYFGADIAMVQPGDPVAVFGAGPVGLAAAYSALLRGASEVYVVDHVPDRLQKAEQIGAIPINFDQGNPVEQIFEKRRQNANLRGALRPGEEKMLGVNCGIDAVGYEAADEKDPAQQRPNQVLDNLIDVVNATGHIGDVGVYFSHDPQGVNPQESQGQYVLPYGELFEKGITVGGGQAPVKRYNEQLRDMIIDGRAKPDFIVSQHIPLSNAPEAYKAFDHREPGFSKVIFKP